MIPILLALAAPPSFVKAVEQRLEGAQLHLVDWWADDLDGDRVLESIAFACNDDKGVFLVQHGTQLLEMLVLVDRHNPCPPARARPKWRVAYLGTINEHVNVDNGSMDYAFAIRGGQLVVLREHDQGGDGDSPQQATSETDLDFEALMWAEQFDPPTGKPTRRSGPMILVTDRVRRPTKIIGATTIAATRGSERDDDITLHVHADRALVIRNCEHQPCTSASLARGDTELRLPNVVELELDVDGTAMPVHVESLVGNESYPPPPSTW